MSLLFLLMMVALLFIIAVFILKKNITEIFSSNISIVILIGVVVSIIATFVHDGQPYDLGCFDAWSRMLYRNGPSSFYTSDAATDYPPGYMYVLWMIGFIRDTFERNNIGYNYILLLKFPAIMADVVTGVLIYSIAEKRVKERSALILALCYMLNPMVLFDSAVWGQVDSINTLLAVVSLKAIVDKRLLKSSLFFTLGVLVKPQNFMFAPIYMYVFFMNLREEAFGFRSFLADKKRRYFNILEFIASGKSFWKLLGTYFRWLLLCAALAGFVMLPFADTSSGGYDFTLVLSQYIGTLSQYNYATVNAYNFWALFGMNWFDGSRELFLGITAGHIGAFMLAAIVGFSFYSLWRAKAKSNFFFTAALINLCAFMLSIKMHERYIFPTLAMLMFAYIYRRDKRIMWLYWGVSAAALINCADVFRATLENSNWALLETTSIVFAVPFAALFAMMIIWMFDIYREGREDDTKLAPELPVSPESGVSGSEEIIPNSAADDISGELKPDLLKPDLLKPDSLKPDSLKPDSGSPDSLKPESGEPESGEPESGEPEPFRPERSEIRSKFTKWDWILMGGLTVVYAVVAFVNLGAAGSPQTYWKSGEAGKGAVIELNGSPESVRRMHWLLGARNHIKLTVETSPDGIVYTEAGTTDTDWVFAWASMDIGQRTRFVRVSGDSGELYLMEVGFESDSGELIPASCPDAPELLDEQEYIPVGLPDREPVSSYWTGTYFDEIYHARTAYEFVQGLPVYETTHPPLGKVFIAAGVEIFGMTPFGWRFAGTLFGVLMIPLMFLFARRIFGDAFWAFAVSLLFAFDFMHFAQTRIATIDTFITFFVIAMYYYMYKYYRMSWNDTPLAKTLAPLGMSGLMMGLGVASKWPGVYAGAGLAALFFLTVWKRFKEYRLAGAVLSREPSDSSLSDSEPEERETARAVRAKFWKYTAITLAACVGFFAVVPAVVYVLSYIPYYLTGSLFGGDADKWISQGLLPGGDAGKLIGGVIRAQSFMFDYHYNLVSDHPYASQWWSWPIILKPIFFYSHYYTDSVSGGISSFGNPVVWLGGLAALIFGARETYHGRDTGIWKFVLIAWLAQYVFWIPVPRTTYIYHYFPCVPFLAVALGLALKRACERFGSKRPAYIVMGAALLLFALYYPVLSGIPVAKWYVNWVLKLAAPNWQLII